MMQFSRILPIVLLDPGSYPGDPEPKSSSLCAALTNNDVSIGLSPKSLYPAMVSCDFQAVILLKVNVVLLSCSV